MNASISISPCMPSVRTASRASSRDPLHAECLIDLLPIRVFIAAPGEVRGPHGPRGTTAEDQRCRPFWMSRCKENAHRCPLGQAVKGGSSRADCVHHGPDIIHTRLEGRSTRDRIRHPGPALVKPDQS